MARHSHAERHYAHRVGWLRAAVLGANDGIVSTAALVVGVAEANSDRRAVLLAGLAGLVAGAMSMAAGEFVSVSSQADTEKADVARERRELEENPARELEELTGIYVERGLEPELARKVAEQLSAKGVLHAHLRDELGITEAQKARPTQAALASAGTFSVGAVLPLIVAVFSPASAVAAVVSAASLVALAILGALAARAGGANPWRGAIRVTFWSAIALAITALVGRVFGTSL